MSSSADPQEPLPDVSRTSMAVYILVIFSIKALNGDIYSLTT